MGLLEEINPKRLARYIGDNFDDEFDLIDGEPEEETYYAEDFATDILAEYDDTLDEADDTGYWFTTQTGIHIYVEPGQSKTDAIRQKFKQFRAKEPPKQKWQDPPAPGKGRDPSIKGGVTAIGMTNTRLGDLGEMLLSRDMGMKSLIPEGDRRNPLDLKWDGSDLGFELKAITTDAKEYKIKMKANEVESKVAYAKANGLKPGMAMLVIDRKKNVGYAYRREGIGNYRLNQDWTYMGRVEVTKQDLKYRKPKKNEGESDNECDAENREE